MHFNLDTAFAMVATLIINILSVPVNLQQISNWTTTFILRVWKVRHRTDGIWGWGPAGRHASGNRNRLKGARDCHRTQDDHHWAWGQTPAPHHPLCPSQSSASLLCPRQPAQVGSHCPGAKAAWLCSIQMWLLLHPPQLCCLLWDENEEILAKSPLFLHCPI